MFDIQTRPPRPRVDEVEAAAAAIESAARAASPLPTDLEEIPAGIELALAVAAIAPTRLSGYDLVRLLKAQERLSAHYQAEGMVSMVDISHIHPTEYGPMSMEAEWEFASDEIRAALTLTRYGADSRLDLATALVEELPQVLGLLSQGKIDFHRARVVVQGTSHLDPNERQELVDSILSQIPDLTSGELKALLRKLAVETNPDRAKRRYEQAVEDRRVWIEATDDGTANLYALDLPIDRARAIGRRLNGYALSHRNAGDQRSMDQLRTDTLLDLLDGQATRHGAKQGSIDLRIDLTTLAGLDDNAAEIPGLGPVIADIARQIADRQTDSHWRYTAIDDQGNVIDTGVARRRFSPAQRRLIEARHLTCGFPGCRMPASDCDIDHTDPFASGGPTTVGNGTPECRHDHILIHRGGWKHRVIGGRHLWTSPLGHTYIKKRPP